MNTTVVSCHRCSLKGITVKQHRKHPVDPAMQLRLVNRLSVIAAGTGMIGEIIHDIDNRRA